MKYLDESIDAIARVWIWLVVYSILNELKKESGESLSTQAEIYEEWVDADQDFKGDGWDRFLFNISRVPDALLMEWHYGGMKRRVLKIFLPFSKKTK